MHLGARRVVLIRLGACCFGAADILIGPRMSRIILEARPWLCGVEGRGTFASYSFVPFGAFGTRCRVTESSLYLIRRFRKRACIPGGKPSSARRRRAQGNVTRRLLEVAGLYDYRFWGWARDAVAVGGGGVPVVAVPFRWAPGDSAWTPGRGHGGPAW